VVAVFAQIAQDIVPNFEESRHAEVGFLLFRICGLLIQDKNVR